MVGRIYLIVGMIVFTVLLCLYQPEDIKEANGEIDQDFDGIQAALSSRITVHVVVIHGVGSHCIGYSNRLSTRIANALDYLPENQLHQNIQTYSTKDCMKVESSKYVRPVRVDTAKDDRLCKRLYKLDKSCRRLVIYTNPDKEKSNFYEYGYIRTNTYRPKNGDTTEASLIFHELTWDAVTRWAKGTYVEYIDGLEDANRLRLNASLKKVLTNDSITDAVLYLSDYKQHMQLPILLALCRVIESQADATDVGVSIPRAGDPSDFSCKPTEIMGRIKDANDFSTKNELVIITHSLGTRMAFDTLGSLLEPYLVKRTIRNLNAHLVGNQLISRSDAEVEREQTAVRDLTFAINRSVNKIFTLSNQIPLLEMGEIKSPEDMLGVRATNNPPPGPAHLGTGFQRFLQNRAMVTPLPARPLQLTALSDPNDLLSYNLKCWYFLNVLRYDKDVASLIGIREAEAKAKAMPKPPAFEFRECGRKGEEEIWQTVAKSIRISSVSVDLAEWSVPFLYADASGAHTNYFRNDYVAELIACGGSTDGNPKSCHEVKAAALLKTDELEERKVGSSNPANVTKAVAAQ